MKYVIVGTSRTDKASSREILEVFSSFGTIEGTTAVMAGLDGRTVVTIVETDDASLLHKSNLTYSPYFEDVRLIPVRDIDESVVADVQEAQANWPT